MNQKNVNDNTKLHDITSQNFIYDPLFVIDGKTLDILYVNSERISSVLKRLEGYITDEGENIYAIITDDFSNSVIIEVCKNDRKIVEGDINSLRGNILIIIKKVNKKVKSPL